MARTWSSATRRWSKWVHAWTALSLPGVCLAILTWEPAKVIGVAAFVAFPLVLHLMLVEHGDRQRDGRTLGQVAGWTGRVVLCAVTFVVSIVAIGAAVGGAAVLLLLALAAATTPPATYWCRRALGQGMLPAAPQAEAESATPPPALSALPEAARKMSDAELCGAWRHSFWTLLEAPDPVTKMIVVLQRQCLLDELEARNATALAAWLASGPRPSGSPQRFLDDGEGHQPTAA